MMFGPFQNPTVLVLGLGDSGLAMASWCARQGCELYLADTRATPPNAARFCERDMHHTVQCGPFTPALLDLPNANEQPLANPINLIALSPGLSPLEPGLSSLLEEAQKRGIMVWGELEFFAQALSALHTQGYAPKILAITGTNGKTTTTALTGLLCKQAGLRTVIAGNIGPSLLDELAQALDAAHDLPEVWVLELSSFQLQATSSFSPSAAALLNMSVDHLDWHETFEAYARAKARIFGPVSSPRTAEQSIRVLNRNDPHTLCFAQERDAVPALSLQTRSTATLGTVTFGLDIPKYAGDWGLMEAPGITWLVRAKSAQASTEKTAAQHEKAPQIEYIIPANALRIEGRHNLANALAALALCSALDIPLAPLVQGLREYRGEAHRFEHVASFDGLRFIDDSKATNVGATLAALASVSNYDQQHVVLILGGEGKGQDFSDLVEPVAQTCRAVILIGQAASDLRASLLPSRVPLFDCTTLEQATRAAAAFAEPGNTILLSPCCASLDMFRNYIHRAEVFRGTVSELAAESGVVV